ncbi:major capsid protein [Cellulomonas sp. ACRRI]|uniref:major capsid protein n=1 Tax=Cellulomonas sp. ACRRI TaxID=2918188 RepID=UPI001EF389ED|nr:major capsid protein [Cellulomonas sp. ACRRI]MCG7284970.1 major capsid protein [Cellulomonas sp. ACRRI]
MAVFGTGDLKNLPRNIADGMVKDAKTGSTIAALSGREAQRFGNVDIITFNDFPKAEFVGQGADKGSSGGSFGSVTAEPHKAQVTMRFNEEVQWADEDYQLGVLQELADAGKIALARALDLGLYYRINPLTGTAISGWTNYLNTTTKRVEITSTSAADMDIETAVGLVIGAQKPVTGIALDPSYAWTLATARFGDGRKKFPELGFGVNLSSFQGLPASVGDTVSGRPEAADTKVRAIVGDFRSGIRWGVQRDIPVELIKYGDPDGQGDLKRKNQIALRLEIVYGWYVFADRFAVVEDATA